MPLTKALDKKQKRKLFRCDICRVPHFKSKEGRHPGVFLLYNYGNPALITSTGRATLYICGNCREELEKTCRRLGRRKIPVT